MKIFITGGTGFIGKYTTELLSKTNHQLKLLIRKSSNASFPNKPNITLVDGNLTDRQSILLGMEGCDSVINMCLNQILIK